MTDKKEDILKHFEAFNQWVGSLKNMDDALWLQPIAPGKWSVGEIICHFIYWDRYFLDQRLPLMKQGNELPPAAGTESFNIIASEKARNQLTQGEVLELFSRNRKELLRVIGELSTEELNVVFSIRNKRLTLSDYLDGLIEHDLHHQNQVAAFLQEQDAPV